jgi:hypothetical protein
MKRLVLLAVLAAAVVFLAGEIPYAAARSASPAGYEFGGRLRWVDDLNMWPSGETAAPPATSQQQRT